AARGGRQHGQVPGALGRRPRRRERVRPPAPTGPMRRARSALRLILATLVAAAAITAPHPAGADHTGVLQLNDRVGPYVVMAWTQPKRPRTDACQIAVSVLRPGSFRPVPDAIVRVGAQPDGAAGGSVSVAGDRGRDPNGINHVADLALPGAGRWTVTVSVAGSEGAGSASFPLDVEAASRGIALASLGAGAALLGLAAVWLLRRGRSRAAPARAGPGQRAGAARGARPTGRRASSRP